jgi:phage head maturation protease
MIESLKRGDITSSSFAFNVLSSGEVWKKNSDGTYLRTITRFNSLHDFSIVPNPAYEATSVNVRGLELLINQGTNFDFKNYIEVMKKKYL